MEKIDFRSAIAKQPKMLEVARPLVTDEIGTALSRVPSRAKRAPIVTGIGASFYAALTMLPYWHQLGVPAHCYSSGELYGAAPGLADLVIAVSASGRSVEPIKVLEALKPTHSIGLACSADNPLSPHVETMVASHCTVDSSPNTASFVGTVQALAILGESMAGVQPERQALCAELERVISDLQEPVKEAASKLLPMRSIDCVGNASNCGIAGYGALLLREFARLSAQPWATHNFLHGPMEANDSSTAAVVIGDEREVELATDMAGHGITTVLLTSRTNIPSRKNLSVCRLACGEEPVVRAIATAMAVQMLAVEVAEGLGFESCVFRYRHSDTKVTDNHR